MSKLKEAALAAEGAKGAGAAEAAASEALRAVKAWAAEYELVGTIDGTYAGRWMIAAFAENAAAVWPDGTAVYVRRIKK